MLLGLKKLNNVLTLYSNSKCFDNVLRVNYVITCLETIPSNLDALQTKMNNSTLRV